MADLDSRDKRQSAILYALPWRALPNPDGSDADSADQRANVVYLYESGDFAEEQAQQGGTYPRRKRIRWRELVTLPNGVKVKTTPEMAELLRQQIAEQEKPRRQRSRRKAREWQSAVAAYLGGEEASGAPPRRYRDEMERLSEERRLAEAERAQIEQEWEDDAIALLLLVA